jgi:DNA-directed RNA polymerase specialized sigma24 family protein
MQAKRGGRITGGDFTLSEPCIDNIVDYLHRDPGPDICAELGDLTRYLLRLLPDDQIRSVATWRMAGYSNSEIAQKLNCTERTIERKLKLIRELWSRNSAESNHS